MGSPAARLGDPTVHGGVIVSGFQQVVIGDQPAARVTDLHICPLSTGSVPHVGGPMIVGALSVMVGNQPQSREGDALTCTGPPDAVATGCPTVMVGMAGGGMGAAGLKVGLSLGVMDFLDAAGEAVIQTIYDVADTAADAVDDLLPE
jgi:uncharacterized Zn-binding protein involved in type VI secretion